MEDLSEQDQLQRALEMSMNNEGGGDADEMMAVLNSLPGVDAKDERIQKALEGLQDKKDKDSKKDEDKDNK